MNKSEMVSAIAEKAELSKVDAAKALDAVVGTIQEALQSGDSVALIGFGTFTVKERAAKKGRNPKTGQEIEIAAAKVPSFKPGAQLKSAVN